MQTEGIGVILFWNLISFPWQLINSSLQKKLNLAKAIVQWHFSECPENSSSNLVLLFKTLSSWLYKSYILTISFGKYILSIFSTKPITILVFCSLGIGESPLQSSYIATAYICLIWWSLFRPNEEGLVFAIKASLFSA